LDNSQKYRVDLSAEKKQFLELINRGISSLLDYIDAFAEPLFNEISVAFNTDKMS